MVRKKDANVPGIARDLETELRRLEQVRDEFQVHVKSTNAEIRRVKAALRALGQAAATARDRGPAAALTTAEVVQLIDANLPPDGKRPLMKLRVDTEAAARAGGRSLIGFHLRFRKALQSERFVVTGEGDAALVSRRVPAASESQE